MRLGRPILPEAAVEPVIVASTEALPDSAGGGGIAEEVPKDDAKFDHAMKVFGIGVDLEA